jgi:hypothetical protein
MARGPNHSKNWGGKRKGAGSPHGRTKTGPNRMTAVAIDMASKSRIHPLQFLLDVIDNDEVELRDRLNASAAALPYCLSKKATELIVTNDFDGKSRGDLEGRLLAIRQERLALEPAVIEGELVNAS